MALPEKPTQLGWYRFGPAPGDRAGAVVLAGHVDSDRYGAGPLARVAGLERGDRIEVHDADGDTTTYVVKKVQRISKDDFSPDDVFDRSGPAVLRLVTCGGAYDERDGGYQDNLVVTATPPVSAEVAGGPSPWVAMARRTRSRRRGRRPRGRRRGRGADGSTNVSRGASSPATAPAWRRRTGAGPRWCTHWLSAS